MKKVLSFILSLALVLSVVYTGAVTFSIPAKADAEKVLKDELQGYRRITAANIIRNNFDDQVMKYDNDGDDSLLTISDTSAMRYDGTFDGKTYLDTDISFPDTISSSYAICWQANSSDKFKNSFLIYKKSATELFIRHYDSSRTLSNLCIATVPSTGFFNLKLLTDIKKASSSAATATIDWQCWINDVYCAGGTITGEPTNITRKIFSVTPTVANPIILRVPETNVIESFKGYKRIDMFDSNQTLTDGVVSLNAGTNSAFYVSDFDKTYLDIDVNYTAGGNMCYLAPNTDWNRCIYLYFRTTTSFRLGYYNTGSKDTNYVYDFDPTTYNAAPGSYFNMKVRVDINAVDENLEDVTVQLWFNNRFVVEKTIRFDYTDAASRLKTYIRNKSKAITIRSSTDPYSQLENCKRVEPTDFSGYDQSNLLSDSGDSTSTTKIGSYSGNAQDLADACLSADIKTPIADGTNPFLVWPSKNVSKTTFYGDGEQLRFIINGTTLNIWPIHSGSNDGTISIGDISSYYSASDFFNIKIKTRSIYDGRLRVTVWVNNHFLKSVFVTCYTSAIIADMTSMGIRGTTNNTTYIKTPKYDGILNDVEYDIDAGNYTLTGEGLVVNGVSMTAGDTISTTGVYVIERDDGTNKSFQTVSIYNEVPQYKLHSLLLDDTIGANFFMNLDGLTETQKANSYMTFAIKGSTKEMASKFDSGFNDLGGNGYYGFTCKLTSVQMADKITPTFHFSLNGVEKAIVGATYSAKDYIDYVEANPHLFGDDAVALVGALANYGYYAQQQFASKTVTALSTDYKAVDDYSSYYATLRSQLSSYSHTKSGTYSYNLNFSANTVLLIRYNNTINVTFDSVTCGGSNYDNKYTRYSESPAFSELQISLPVLSLGSKFTVSGTNEGTPFDITDISAWSYIYAILGGSNTNLKNAVCALYDYYHAAYKYEYGVDFDLNSEWI